jgi:signal transduction histidine kinase
MMWQKRFGLELLAVVALIAVVAVLAAYQYRWTGEISRTEQVRLKNSLATSVRSFDQEFSYDFQQLCESFELDPEADPDATESRVARQFVSWNRVSSHAQIVDSVHILRFSVKSSALESFNENDNQFHHAEWPPQLGSLQPLLERQYKLAIQVKNDRDAVYYPWTFYGDAPALVRPIFRIWPGTHDPGRSVGAIGILVVALDRDYFERQYLSELVDRHFGAAGQRSFAVSVRMAKAPYRTIYATDARSPIVTDMPDVAVNLFDLIGEEARRRGHPPLQANVADQQWQLAAQHPSGSLDEAVASWRRRNLAINLGLLAILSGSMALLFSAARRSRMLARMQMEFVAGVSHELCTPLSVINTAAENLADGIVENAGQMQEYGILIRGQGRRLERLVDEVLLFTAGRFGLSGYELKPVEVAAIISQSLSTSEASLHDAGFTLAKEIKDGMPPIVADPSAVITCIENVVSNAIKYSDSSKWVAIRAYEASRDSKPEVRISVEDKGIGISSADLAHVFEPFYRVQSARDNQIRGVGLGLYLVKRMMEDMGGRVSVTSVFGRGTEVVLHFPVADLRERTVNTSS